jgi:hypothetical protein
MASILRPKQAWATLGIGYTTFSEKYVLHDERDPFVPGTTIRRVRSVPLGARAVGYFDDEIAALVEALRALRDDPTAMRPERAPIPAGKHHHGKKKKRSEAA